MRGPPLRHRLILILLAAPLFGQTQPTGTAETSGFCSPANTGNNNQFTIHCENVPAKLQSQIVDILNRITKNQTDAEAILRKLDGCLDGVREVREQQLPWLPTLDQKNGLRLRLQGSKARFRVHAIYGDKNAHLMAKALANWLVVGCEWSLSDRVLMIDSTLDTSLTGIVIGVSHKDFPEAVRLHSALNDVGIRATLNDHTGVRIAEDEILIVVGGRPL
jgi:hypothetical protein